METSLLLQPDYFPYSIALGVLLTILAIEVIGLMVGFDLINVADALIPDVEIDVSSTSLIGHGFGWFMIGRVPFLILLIGYLVGFAALGFFSLQVLGKFLPDFLYKSYIVYVNAGLAIFPMRWTAKVFIKVFPDDISQAVSVEMF